MKKAVIVLFALTMAGPLFAAPETWKNVPLIDTKCEAKVKADPDAHPTSCALMCAPSGYGILAADGSYLKLDAAGNKMALAALKNTKKTDHLRATVTGERDGDKIKVESLALD